MSQSIPTGYILLGNPQKLAQKDCPGGQDLAFESCPGARNSTRVGILWKLKVEIESETFCLFIGFISDFIGVPKIANN